ncbi:MAG: hypothetical protein FJ295_01345 [Planctomycetes bacterium]|nr:hypothetical protein [Planctomycetota bacterium]
MHADQDGLPPVRRSPVLSAGPRTADAKRGEQAAPNDAALVGVATPDRRGGEPRRGSPFNSSTTWQSGSYRATTSAARSAERAPVYLVAGIASAAVAAFSFLLVESLPVAAMALAAFAIGLAVFALHGPRRWIASTAILLAMISFGWAGYEFAVQIYILRHGVSPWPKEPEGDVEFEMEE